MNFALMFALALGIDYARLASRFRGRSSAPSCRPRKRPP